jgi:hypothetical protein
MTLKEAIIARLPKEKECDGVDNFLNHCGALVCANTEIAFTAGYSSALADVKASLPEVDEEAIEDIIFPLFPDLQCPLDTATAVSIDEKNKAIRKNSAKAIAQRIGECLR